MNQSVIEKLLQRKQSKCVEVEIHLFENCNIACGYCSQDHRDSGPNKENFDEKRRLALAYMSSLKGSNTSIAINLMGGELFQDKFDRTVYELYLDLIEELYREARLLYQDVYFGITSNLLFKDGSNVDWLLGEMRAKGIQYNLRTSMDLKGRPTGPRLKETFEANAKYYKSDLSCISFCLHALNIEELLNARDLALRVWYWAGYTINFDWYIPDPKLSGVYMPSDEQCREALKYLFKWYPKASPVKDWYTKGQNPIQCCSENRVLIPADNNVSSCVYLPHKQEDYHNGINRTTTYDKATTWILNQGCISCDYFERCGFYCYAAADFRGRKASLSCFIQEALDDAL